MEEKGINQNLGQLSRKFFGVFSITILSIVAVSLPAFPQGDENFESSAPILISEADSTRALTANPDNWKGMLPKKNSEIFLPGSRVVVFVTNINLLPDEGANAFRAFAEDSGGKRYRLTIENISKLSRQNWIYGLTLRLYDANGYNGQPPNGEL